MVVMASARLSETRQAPQRQIRVDQTARAELDGGALQFLQEPVKQVRESLFYSQAIHSRGCLTRCKHTKYCPVGNPTLILTKTKFRRMMTVVPRGSRDNEPGRK